MKSASHMATAFGVDRKITTIHNAVSLDWTWRYRHSRPEAVHVVSDCGYSLKKGTHILLHSGNLYASATLGEGSSNATLAALICGLPIVATDCGGLADLARDEPHVALSEPGDRDAFRDSLREMYSRILSTRVEASDELIARVHRSLDPATERHGWQQAVLRTLAAGEL
jgi:glycosyltransferase involved in cell wall biosynthesis